MERPPLLLRALAGLLLAITLLPPAALAQEEPVPPKVRAAVDRALEWLAQSQREDGTWPQNGGRSTTAVPSLAVMAFLAAGHVPGQGPYGERLNRSIDHVLDSQRENGLISRANNNAMMYEHGISTVMLSEVYGMVDDERRVRIGAALRRSVKLILDAQKIPQGGHRGGWRYSPNAPDADISVTGWQLMALRGAANCGAAVPGEALRLGREYVKRNAVASGGFSYQPGGSANVPRTGTGILSMELLGEHHSPEAIAGGEYLLKHSPDNPDSEFYFYGVYYCSQALNQLGGKYWDEAYPKLREALLTRQQDNGAWRGGQGEESSAGEAYRTAMAVLALTVPYRYLPLYQK